MLNIFNSIVGTETNFGVFAGCIISAAAIGFIISVLYKFTHKKGRLYAGIRIDFSYAARYSVSDNTSY